MGKLIIFTVISIFFILPPTIVAQINTENWEKTEKAISDLGLHFPGWSAKKPNEKISRVYLTLLDKDVEKKKYDTSNPVITCLDKNSDLYKRGVKLYDEIVEVNGKHPSLYENSSEPFDVKIKRGNQILNLKKINPVFFGKRKLCLCS